MGYQEKVMEINKILASHGYTPKQVDAFEIFGERKNRGLIEDLDVVLFAPDFNMALNRYFKYIKGTTPNIYAAYFLPRVARTNLISMIHEDPAFQGRLDFILEKGLIIGPGDERISYANVAHLRRREIEREFFIKSLDQVIEKVESGIGGSEQADVRVHDDKYCGIVQ